MASIIAFLAIFALVWWSAIWFICLLGLFTARNTFAYKVPLRVLLKRGVGSISISKKNNNNIQSNDVSLDEEYDEVEEQDDDDDDDDYIDERQLPNVSILRPLCGIDTNLYENIESTFLQEYPLEKFEILCSVAREDDAAVQVVEQVKKKYPMVHCQLVIGQDIVGVNPKINNLARSYTLASHDIVWIIDSNIFIQPQTLLNSTKIFMNQPKIGLVHHVPHPTIHISSLTNVSSTARTTNDNPYRDQKPKYQHQHQQRFNPIPTTASLGSYVESSFMGCTHAKMYLALNATQVDSCLNGKSNMFKKSQLEKAVYIQKGRMDSETMGEGLAEEGRRGNRRGSNINNNVGYDNQGECVQRQAQSNPLAHFASYLGEDNMIGSAIWHELGLRHAFTSDVAWNVLGNSTSMKTYFQRRVRWIRVRKYMVTASTLVEPMTESLICGLIGSFSVKKLFGVSSIFFFFIHIFLWFFVDLLVFASISNSSSLRRIQFPNFSTTFSVSFKQATSPSSFTSTSTSSSSPSTSSPYPSPLTTQSPRTPTSTPAKAKVYLPGWIIREICALPLWIYAILGDLVGWRGNQAFKVMRDGTVKLVQIGEGSAKLL